MTGAAGPEVPTVDAVYGHVGQRLRHLRVRHGLTQAQVAKVISISPQQYQKYEEAQSKCSLPYLLALAEHYGIHVNDLLPVEGIDRDPDPEMVREADLLARLVASFVQFEDAAVKLRLVQLVEAMVSAQNRPTEPKG